MPPVSRSWRRRRSTRPVRRTAPAIRPSATSANTLAAIAGSVSSPSQSGSAPGGQQHGDHGGRGRWRRRRAPDRRSRRARRTRRSPVPGEVGVCSAIRRRPAGRDAAVGQRRRGVGTGRATSAGRARRRRRRRPREPAELRADLVEGPTDGVPISIWAIATLETSSSTRSWPAGKTSSILVARAREAVHQLDSSSTPIEKSAGAAGAPPTAAVAGAATRRKPPIVGPTSSRRGQVLIFLRHHRNRLAIRPTLRVARHERRTTPDPRVRGYTCGAARPRRVPVPHHPSTKAAMTDTGPPRRTTKSDPLGCW